mgnify:CR=1 FL=1
MKRRRALFAVLLSVFAPVTEESFAPSLLAFKALGSCVTAKVALKVDTLFVWLILLFLRDIMCLGNTCICFFCFPSVMSVDLVVKQAAYIESRGDG